MVDQDTTADQAAAIWVILNKLPKKRLKAWDLPLANVVTKIKNRPGATNARATNIYHEKYNAPNKHIIPFMAANCK